MVNPTRELLLGRYVLLQEHQVGGMASIYKARDISHDSVVAVKRFDRDKHLPEIEAESYRRDVEALRNLTHPHIVRILDQGEDDRKKPFLVLEWMSHDLIEHRKRNASAFDGWDDFAEQVAMPLLQALAHAHANGIYHRDVKPGNILVADDGTIKLADFGISKLKRSLQPRITLNEFVSRPYAPPEPDDGAFSYSRDVYGFAVTCLWALSDTSPTDYGELGPALAQADLQSEVRDVLARCLSTNPVDRPGTAGILEHELTRIQSRRVQVWAEKGRKHCQVKLTRTAQGAIGRQIGYSDEGPLHKFAEQDMNDEATIERVVAQRATPQERIVPKKYYVHGGRLSYQIAPDDRGYLSVISARANEPEWHQKLKQMTPRSPITFAVVPRKAGVDCGEAMRQIEEALVAAEEMRQRDEAEEAQEKLFTTWRKVLDARSTFERERCEPLFFSSSVVNGRYVTLQVAAGQEGVAVEQSRVIEFDGRRVIGVVYEIAGEQVILHCPNADLAKFPQSGRARIDTRATDIALDRQRTAIEYVRTGAATRSDLRDILINPGTARPPDLLDPPHPTATKDLDEFQMEALNAALNSQDVLLVQGPPGTGKTRFITNLVRETLARSQRSRILLTSQTHVAIDNALERLAESCPDLRMLRIARDGAAVVSDPCRPYLVDSQLECWRTDVESGSAAWLRDWAQRRELNPDDIATGRLLKQIAGLRANVSRLRSEIRSKDAELAVPPDRADGLDDEQAVNRETLEREAGEARVQLDSDKNYIVQLETQLRRKHLDAEQFLTMSADELAEWSELLVGKTEAGRKAEEIMELQAEWLGRFGRDPSFLGALCERSSVVAATCIGLVALRGAADVVYDLCIIDEASKATATEAVVPLVRARRWVFVGDSRQLPPFEDEVQRSESLRQRFDIDDEEAKESLFERFRRLLPPGCQKMLRKQYRMVSPIGRMISECFYEGEVESVPRPLDPCLVSVTGRAVAWITTRYLANRIEQFAEPSYVNPAEAERILDLLGEFESAVEGSEDRVTVQLLSGYSGQVQHLRRSIDRYRHSLPHLEVECSTIDSVQGREADVVIFSVTRSNDGHSIGFLGQLSRINVALSRAREALVIVGDDDFVQRTEGAGPLLSVLQYINQHPEDCVLRSFDPPGSPKGVHR